TPRRGCGEAGRRARAGGGSGHGVRPGRKSCAAPGGGRPRPGTWVIEGSWGLRARAAPVGDPLGGPSPRIRPPRRGTMNRALSAPPLGGPALPAPRLQPPAAPSEPDASADQKPAIIVADDKALVLTLLGFELQRYDFSVQLALDGRQAVRLYR